jgi:hypothetical protein
MGCQPGKRQPLHAICLISIDRFKWVPKGNRASSLNFYKGKNTTLDSSATDVDFTFTNPPIAFDDFDVSID